MNCNDPFQSHQFRRNVKPQTDVRINKKHPLAKRLRHAYFFAENTGVARDIAGGHDGILNSGSVRKLSTNGKIINLDGSTGFVEVTTSPDLSIYPGGFTILCRCRPHSFSGIDKRLVNKFPSIAGNRQYVLWADIGNTCWGAATYTGGSTNSVDNNSSTVDIGRWQDVAMTFDYSNLRVWKDGFDYQSTVAASLQSTTARVLFGARPDPTEVQFFDGDIEFILYFDYALTRHEFLLLKRNAYDLIEPVSNLIVLPAVVAAGGVANPWNYYANQ